jgi:small subunit ribosomal protein S21
MLKIEIKDNESIDKALKRFKKKFERVGILKQLRKRTAFEKPSITNREIVKKAIYRRQILEAENQ